MPPGLINGERCGGLKLLGAGLSPPVNCSGIIPPGDPIITFGGCPGAGLKLLPGLKLSPGIADLPPGADPVGKPGGVIGICC